MITKLTIWLLQRAKITQADRIALTTAILNKLLVIPICSIIESNVNEPLKINGRYTTLEEAKWIREGAKTALLNPTLKLIRDQVAYAAVNIGVHQAQTNDHLFFAKSALWYHQNLEKLLNEIAGIDTDEPVV